MGLHEGLRRNAQSTRPTVGGTDKWRDGGMVGSAKLPPQFEAFIFTQSICFSAVSLVIFHPLSNHLFLPVRASCSFRVGVSCPTYLIRSSFRVGHVLFGRVAALGRSIPP